jgi:hypothetical protein
MESRTDRQKSRGFFENFNVKWKFQGKFTEGITVELIKKILFNSPLVITSVKT